MQKQSKNWPGVQYPLKYIPQITDIYMGDPRPPISPCVMASSAMGLKLGVFGFLPTTHAKTNAIQMPSRSLRAVQHFTHVYLHAKSAVDAGDIICI